MCRNDHIGEAFVHSQDRGGAVQTVRKLETMDSVLTVVVTQDHRPAACKIPVTQKFS